MVTLKVSSYKNPLDFKCVKKPFDWYVKELKAWCLFMELGKEKESLSILSLPENDTSCIRDKTFNELTWASFNGKMKVRH